VKARALLSFASLSLVSARLRALLLAFLGAKIGSKVGVGSGCRLQRPTRLLLGTRVHVEHNVFFKIESDSATLRIGDYTFIGNGTQFDVTQHVEVGKKVLIAPGCFIVDHNHNHMAGTTIADQGCCSARVSIEDGAWLGAHAVILPGVTIGAGAVVAAGAVVSRDVAPNSIVAGVPARVVAYRN
jgi:acetyltransferase-like isoleucine patch superfamily enzyme